MEMCINTASLIGLVLIFLIHFQLFNIVDSLPDTFSDMHRRSEKFLQRESGPFDLLTLRLSNQDPTIPSVSCAVLLDHGLVAECLADDLPCIFFFFIVVVCGLVDC